MTDPLRRWPDGTTERRAPLARRDASATRLRLTLEIAVPVLLRSDEGLTRGIARNISEGGMLVEVEALPPIGSPVDVTISGVHGSSDAPHSLTLKGEIRHHLAWQYVTERSRVQVMRGIGIRFANEDGADEHRSAQSWLDYAGETVH